MCAFSSERGLAKEETVVLFFAPFLYHERLSLIIKVDQTEQRLNVLSKRQFGQGCLELVVTFLSLAPEVELF